jgi:hypothetical protein
VGRNLYGPAGLCTVARVDDASGPLTVGRLKELMERHGVPDDAVLVGPPLAKGLGPSRLLLSAISIKMDGESTVTLTQFASERGG